MDEHKHMEGHGHDHDHEHGCGGGGCCGGECENESSEAAGFGPFQGSPKTMFFLGFFAGIALCTTLSTLLVVSSIASGKGFLLGSGKATTDTVAQAPAANQPAANQPSNTQPTPSAAAPVKAVDEKADHITGAKNAKVTLIEYSDFECPFCKRHFATMEQVLKDYPNDVRLVFRHFPLSFHANAEKEAEASECAAELGGNDAFWRMHDKIFTETTSNGTGFALDRLGPAAKEIGLDQAKFQSCLDSGRYAKKVAQDQSEGGNSGVEGTPATFINGEMVSGAVPYATFKAKIDAILAKK